MKTLIYTSIICFLCHRCIEPYEIEESNYEKIIVVDGSISNIEGPYFVSLTYTSPIQETSSNIIRNASVSVLDGSGNIYEYIESDSGLYVSPPELIGQANECYQLLFEVENEKYESSMTMLTASTEIDSIHHKYISRLDEGDDPVTGIQFFLDTHSDEEGSISFRYEWEATYLIDLAYPSLYDFDFSSYTYIEREVSLGRCYSSKESTGFLIATSGGSTENRISDFALLFEDEEDNALISRYSLLVRQYLVDESTYNYYRQIKKNNENGGSLSDDQEGTLIGNIQSINNPLDITLGYFEVSGVNETRVFFDNEDFDEDFEPSFNTFCGPDAVRDLELDSVIWYLTMRPWARIHKPSSLNETLGAEIVHEECSDCSLYATTTKPDFWID